MYLLKSKIVFFILIIILLGTSLLYALPKGLMCSDSNGYITANLAASLSGDLSVEMWVNTTLFGDYQERITSIGNGSSYLQICMANGYIVIDNSGGPTSGISCPGFKNDGFWHQVVVTRSGLTNYILYVDGQYIAECTGTTPAYTKAYIGYSPSQPRFHGAIDDIRVYNRALSQPEVMNNYIQILPANIIQNGLTNWWKLDGNANDAIGSNNGVISGTAVWVPGRGEAMYTVSKIESTHYNIPGKLRVEIDSRQMGTFSSNAVWNIYLYNSIGNVVRQLTEAIPSAYHEVVSLPVEDLPAGNYEVRVQIVSSGQQVGQIAIDSVALTSRPGWTSTTNIRNNLVSEFINESGNINGTRSFYNPRDGWIFFSVTRAENVSTELSLNSIFLTGSKWKNNTHEAMRYLAAGNYTLIINGYRGFTNLIVRSVPELQFCEFLDRPTVTSYGTYDIGFMKDQKILENVNTILTEGNGETYADPYYSEWQENGGRWIYGRPRGDTTDPVTAYQAWAYPLSHTQPFADGLIVDEFMQFTPGDIEAANLLLADSVMNGKYFYPYVCSPSPSHGGENGVTFMNQVMDAGNPVAWERYLQEQPDESNARTMIDMAINRELKAYWLDPMPDSVSHIVMVLGNFLSAIPESLNVYPDVDFKVWMDMQYYVLANDPMFYGLYGLSEWQSTYADEEHIRWDAKLYRHYAIEGNTDMLSPSYGFVYKLTHIQNPDFTNGLSGWTIQNAETGSIQAKSYSGYSILQGRYPTTTQGDTFLWTKRSSVAPNVFSQTINNLVPGKMYSLKIYTSDYQDLVTGTSVDKLHAISINIGGVELIPDKSFQDIQRSKFASGLFGGTNQLRINFHRRIFRAQSTQATLSISDWQDANTPGGTIGQELIYNFIELQPYLELEPATFGNSWLDTVTVGNAGNAADTTTTYGKVDYVYDIGKYEVTASQYCDFLNAKASVPPIAPIYNLTSMQSSNGCKIMRTGSGTLADPYIYTVAAEWANRPVNYVSFWQALRFANWLHNGKGNGDTETGAYTITSNGITNNTITRNSNWNWAVTNENEWYKAAYYDPNYSGFGSGGYWLFPTKSNSTPGRVISTPDSGNNANYNYALGSPYYRTIAGEFENSDSYYGTFDQAGNVWEFNESISSTNRGLRGSGCDASNAADSMRTRRSSVNPSSAGSAWYGFRVVNKVDTSPSLTFTVYPLDFSGDITTIPVTVELGNGIDPMTVYLDADGKFTIHNVAVGTYNIRIKASHWLAKVINGVGVVSGNKIIDPVSLINGDVVDNNEVDFSDINAVRAAYGSFPGDETWNTQADVDGSGEVDFTDINIVRSNYGEIGE